MVQNDPVRSAENRKKFAEKRRARLEGNEKMMKGNIDSSYEFPADEAEYTHYLCIIKEDDPVRKEYVTRKRIVKRNKGHEVQDAKTKSKSKWDDIYDEVKTLHDPKQESKPKKTRKAAKSEKTEAKEEIKEDK